MGQTLQGGEQVKRKYRVVNSGGEHIPRED